VQGARHVHRHVAGPQGTGHRAGDVHVVGFQRVSVAQVLQPVVLADLLAMAAGDELHAAPLDRHVVHRDPEVGRDQAWIERVGLVLVPGRGPAVVGRLVDGVVEAVLDRPSQQRLGQLPAAPKRQRRLQLGLQVERLVDLQDLREVAGRPGAQVPRSAHSGQRVVATVQPGHHAADRLQVVGRRHPLEDRESVTMEGADGVRRKR